MWSTLNHRPFIANDEPRVAVAAVLDGPFGEFTVCNTHLSFIPGWNGLQLRRLMRSLVGTREPLVLIGDLNMERRQAARLSGLRPIATANTFPLARPRRQIDHVLARGAVRATGAAEAVRLPLSDHRALVVPCGPA
jgi:endonuclease/exonuclease/phosphatase family metal-dependent hydrolase